MAGRKIIKGPEEIMLVQRKSPDPVQWSRGKMLAELRTYVKPSVKIEIKHLKGYPSNAGYLEWLRRFDDKFVNRSRGDDEILLHVTNRADFIAKVHEQVLLEIERRKAQLVELERSPEAVQSYVSHLTENALKWRNYQGARQDGDIQKFIRETEETVIEYSRILAILLGVASQVKSSKK
jgi:hypothetical protein